MVTRLNVGVTRTAPEALFEAFGSPLFASRVLDEVIEGTMADSEMRPRYNPALFQIMEPRWTITVDEQIGVGIVLAGMSTKICTKDELLRATFELTRVATETIDEAMARARLRGNHRGSRDGVQLAVSLEPVYDSWSEDAWGLHTANRVGVSVLDRG